MQRLICARLLFMYVLLDVQVLLIGKNRYRERAGDCTRHQSNSAQGDLTEPLRAQKQQEGAKKACKGVQTV